ncbi:ABC transporter permease [Caballeronia sp. AZ10_KS36]|uniref:ABC transporter permease n=1 Tax=Caballeronia sp. AZ10_KS36 TaxID=2921757 RepID=UPI0020284B00|nr:ABC transporter permease [Caballeronia sp. AZ10_KS36]
MNRIVAVRAVLSKPWLWSYAGALMVWLITIGGVRGQGAGGIVAAALAFSVFLVLVGLGQMLVITSGPGNIDLSVPSTITLAGVVSMQLMSGESGMILAGALAAVAVGIAVGSFNYGLIRLLRIPPIIATMSSSFLIQSMAISYNEGAHALPPSTLAAFANGRVMGVPYTAIGVVALAVALGYVTTRTVYGRSLSAIGQNAGAARLAGIRVERTRYFTYAFCAVLAALTGYLLAAFSGGATLDMGDDYMLSSIAVTVIGGTAVAGGRASVPGIWGAALFLFLMVAMLNALGVGAGLRLVITGVLIIGIIIFASHPKN